jgi:UDP-glucose 4-epimerase
MKLYYYMNYLVTGAAGFIGSNLVDRLIELGHDVEGWDNLYSGKIENVNSKSKFTQFNIVKHTVPGMEVDAIFHLAAESRIQPSFQNPKQTYNYNVNGTLNILELARQNKTKFIFAGTSCSYYDKFSNPYAFSKDAAEQVCMLYNKLYKVPVAIARFFNCYGPRQMESGSHATVVGIFEKQKKENKPLTITGDGSKRRDFVHVNDIVEALIAMSNKEYNCDIFQLGSGKNYSIKELAEMFQSEITYIAERSGEAQETLADIEFSSKELNWKPKCSLEEYVKNIVVSI